MKCCTLAFTTRSGVGVQTVTGVVDVDGNPFIGKFFIFQGAFCDNNVLKTLTHNMGYDMGVSDGVNGEANGFGDVFQFSAKICSGMGYAHYCVGDTHPDIFFGGAFDGAAYISAVRSGEFDLTWDQNNRGGSDTKLVTVFGGDDLTTSYNGLTNVAVVTPTIPQGFLSMSTHGAGFGTTSGAFSGAGGQAVSIGFATRDGDQGAMGIHLQNQGINSRALLTDRYTLGLDSSLGLPVINGTPRHVSSWDALSYTTTGSNIGGRDELAFCGSGIKTAGGSFIQQATVGNQTVTTGINAKWLMLATVGNTSSLVADASRCEWSLGWTDQTRQGVYWTGETVSGNGTPLTGVRFVSDSSIIRCAVPDTLSTVFLAVAELVEVDSTGSFTINWTTNDGVAREILWFGVGEQADELGSVEVDKVWDTVTPGQVTLRIGTTPGDDDIASQLTGVDGAAPLVLGPEVVDAGTYYVSETHSNLWDVSLALTVNGVDTPIGPDGQITVANGDVIVVTITNRSNPPPGRPRQWKLYSFNMKLRKEERA